MELKSTGIFFSYELLCCSNFLHFAGTFSFLYSVLISFHFLSQILDFLTIFFRKLLHLELDFIFYTILLKIFLKIPFYFYSFVIFFKSSNYILSLCKKFINLSEFQLKSINLGNFIFFKSASRD